MSRVWGILRKKQRIWQDVTVEANGATDEEAMQEALSEICYKLDIPRPLWLNKHSDEVERFGRTAFTQEHFMEPIAFDKFEVEFLKEKGRSSDPRNDFGTEL